MKLDILALVGALEAEYGVDRSIIFEGLEEAFSTAIRKLYRTDNKVSVSIDRKNGGINAKIGGETVDFSGLKRISFYEVKSLFLKKLNKVKEDYVNEKYRNKIGALLSCKIIKDESKYVLLETSDKVTAIMDRREQIPGENYVPNTMLKVLLVDIKKTRGSTMLVVSRKRKEFIRALLMLEVPEIGEGRCTIVRIARDAGYRSKVLVRPGAGGSNEGIGSCLGYMGSRIKNIVEELKGERIDIIEWSHDKVELIKNSLKPVQVAVVKYDENREYAQVFVDGSHLSQAIGKGGRNVKLASRLCGVEIDVFELAKVNENTQDTGAGN